MRREVQSLIDEVCRLLRPQDRPTVTWVAANGRTACYVTFSAGAKGGCSWYDDDPLWYRKLAVRNFHGWMLDRIERPYIERP